MTGWFRVFGSYESKETNPGLLLLPENWRVTLSRPLRPSRDQLVFDATLYANRVRSGESVTTRRKVWDHPLNSSDVFKSGEYRFVSEYQTTELEKAFDWGFTITVSDS